eukprot:TRINITY_DN63763_c0_g1_i1.p1 TRINITY_DN63763_c0_g1~~TRINITY_DN63763_c0_g1_i1.p1  ORF type:complete len:112 (+),score=18.52 TRINITY_DN63763_c0_g1_i1:45-380(+)
MAFQATGTEKDQLIVGLAALVCGDDCSADNLNAVIKASGNTVPAYYTPLYASFIDKAGGVSKFFGDGPAVGGPQVQSNDTTEAPKQEVVKEEEVDALEGGMSMFGGDGGDY